MVYHGKRYVSALNSINGARQVWLTMRSLETGGQCPPYKDKTNTLKSDAIDLWDGDSSIANPVWIDYTSARILAETRINPVR